MTEVAKKRVRTCVGCGKQSDKVQLYRVVRTGDGDVRFDATGRVPGRGAYVCSRDCLQKAVQGKLQRALKCGIGKDEAARVIEEMEEALSGACAR